MVVAELLEQRPMVVAVVVVVAASWVELETVVEVVEEERVVVDGIVAVAVAVAEESRELVAVQRWWVLDSWFPQVQHQQQHHSW